MFTDSLPGSSYHAYCTSASQLQCGILRECRILIWGCDPVNPCMEAPSSAQQRVGSGKINFPLIGKVHWGPYNPPFTHSHFVCSLAWRIHQSKCHSNPTSFKWECVIKPSNTETVSTQACKPHSSQVRHLFCARDGGNTHKPTNESCTVILRG